MNTREVSTELIHFTIKLKKFFRGQMHELEDCKITEQQFRTLMYLRDLQQCTLKELSKSVKVSTPSLCIMLNKMVEEALVERKTDLKDRRNVLYSLSEKGKKALNEVLEKRLQLLDHKVNVLSEEQKKRLVFAIQEFEEILDFLNK